MLAKSNNEVPLVTDRLSLFTENSIRGYDKLKVSYGPSF